VDERTANRARAWIVGMLGLGALGVLALSAVFDPEAMARGAPLGLVGLEPYHCPGCPLCGMSRAFSSLSHAQLSRAIDFHAGVVVAYPLAVGLGLFGPTVLLRHLFKRS
jgi:hypothetical protein